jgi:Periplasmic binding protein-like domain
VPIAELDAVVAANDYMAFGVIDELSRRRCRVPEQVAVVGFDDMPRARVHQPGLTTVRQPIEQLGHDAVQAVLEQIAGRAVEDTLELGTELVLRRSCGCVPTDISALLHGDGELPGEGSSQLGSTRAAEVVAALVCEAKGEVGAVESAFKPLLQQLSLAGVDPALADDLLVLIRRRALRQLQGEPEQSERAEQALQRCRVLVSELTLRPELVPEDSVSERTHRFTRALLTRMFGPQGPLSATLVQHLPGLGMEECLVAEFVSASDKTELKVALGFNSQQAQPKHVVFHASELAPPEFSALRSKSVFVLPAPYGAQPVGVAILPASGHDGSIYEMLAEVFGIALKGIEIWRRSGGY